MTRGIYLGAALAIACGFAVGDASAQGPSQGARQFAGAASYYDRNYRGRTASGASYDSTKFTAAHRTLPFGTRLSVTDARTHRAVTVVVNDRGPFIKGRVLDLSFAAAQALHMTGRGIIRVTAAVE